MSKSKRFATSTTLSPARLSALADHVAAELGAEPAARVLDVPLDALRENPYQPRRTFDADALRDLTASIQQHGILQPLIGRREADGRVTVIAGHRRWQAARAAGLSAVPVVLRSEVSDADLQVLALIENLQREDLHAVEKARALGAVARRFPTQAQAAQALGMKRSALAMWLRVLELDAAVLEVCATIPQCSLRMLLDLLALAPARRLAAARRLALGPSAGPAPEAGRAPAREGGQPAAAPTRKAEAPAGAAVFRFAYRLPDKPATLRVTVTTTARRAVTTAAEVRAALQAALDRLAAGEA
ncbi:MULTISPECIES: ParB/RepB/Spo0J family partition protein [Chloracidobacterium]|jgi:ParB family chromosome partitioning protein|uniref:ParB-like partition protein n=1 Tax=Chloracidobacterium thermophilum (strain B) TaxID=981222 RepID=G2LJJ3_CHLTF|nr:MULTISPECIES: ParB/RepB/Spo0J family partition protein [Chloracidobacterium]AEP13010.1 ParB-like partition protein [Chloracidobacterium thermophilum B]QUV80285.1 ParB/RepB/Spo0J family partition protein [Chloracidobacterium thermophilum]QUV83184.1 ParB/RepB/Spo0J family partition protein [Chloracidobacterium sp. D]